MTQITASRTPSLHPGVSLPVSHCSSYSKVLESPHDRVRIQSGHIARELFREQGPSRHCARRRCSRRDDQRRPRIPAIGTVLCGEFLVAFEIEVALLEDLLHDGDEHRLALFRACSRSTGPRSSTSSVIAMRALLRAQRQAAPEPIEHNNIWRGRSLLQSVEALPKAL
jgi:hypothetical protein